MKLTAPSQSTLEAPCLATVLQRLSRYIKQLTPQRPGQLADRGVCKPHSPGSAQVSHFFLPEPHSPGSAQVSHFYPSHSHAIRTLITLIHQQGLLLFPTPCVESGTSWLTLAVGHDEKDPCERVSKRTEVAVQRQCRGATWRPVRPGVHVLVGICGCGWEAFGRVRPVWLSVGVPSEGVASVNRVCSAHPLQLPRPRAVGYAAERCRRGR